MVPADGCFVLRRSTDTGQVFLEEEFPLILVSHPGVRLPASPAAVKRLTSQTTRGNLQGWSLEAL